MQRLRVFAVHDSKAEAFLQPMFFLTRGQAMRAFLDALEDEKHEFNKHAEDYTLFEIGEFDQGSGEMLPLKAIVSIGNALALRAERRTA